MEQGQSFDDQVSLLDKNLAIIKTNCSSYKCQQITLIKNSTSAELLCDEDDVENVVDALDGEGEVRNLSDMGEVLTRS